MENTQAKRWVFTINNPTVDEQRNIRDRFPNDADFTDAQRIAVSNIEILIAELETGEQGTLHIQGYITFSTKVYRRVLETILGGRAYIAIARGSTTENIKYCTKEWYSGEKDIVCIGC